MASAVGPEGLIVGIDVAEDAIASAKRRCREYGDDHNCIYKVDSFENIAATASLNTIDVVTVLNVLGYLPHPVESLKTLWGRLGPSARLIVRQYDYGCTIYSGVPTELQFRMLAHLAQSLERTPLTPTCEAFLGRDIRSIALLAGIQNPETRCDSIELHAPFSSGTEFYLREKAHWIAECAKRVAPAKELAAWEALFDPCSAQYVLSRPDASFVTIEYELNAIK